MLSANQGRLWRLQQAEKRGNKEARMAESKPLVSIGMPVFNEERYLEQALQSLLCQSFENFELIISDNASTDRTGEICLTYAAKDPRVRYSRMETNLGSNVNFNRVFQLSNSPYFLWASGHDTRHETFIARCLEILEQDASVVLCYPRAQWLETDGRLGNVLPGHVETRGLSQVSRYRTVLWGLGYVHQLSGIMRSSALKRTGLIRPKMVGSDLILLSELALLGAFAELPEPLLCLQRLSDYGSTTQFLVKALGPSSEGRSSWHLYGKMIYEHARVVPKHTRGFREKRVLVLSSIFCMLTKYRWVLRGLLQRDADEIRRIEHNAHAA
jgi:glycosyltransferase involved in cell wall biosynthesis